MARGSWHTGHAGLSLLWKLTGQQLLPSTMQHTLSAFRPQVSGMHAKVDCCGAPLASLKENFDVVKKLVPLTANL